MKRQEIHRKSPIHESLLNQSQHVDKDPCNKNSKITELTTELKKTEKQLKKLTKKCKQLEKELRESKEIADVFLNTCDEVFVLINLEGTVVQANYFLADRLKTTVKDLLGKNIYQWFPSKLAKKRKKYADKVVKSGKPVHFQDYSNGRWNYNILYPVCDVHGKVVRIAVHARDITRRVRIQEELRIIFDSVRASIWCKDLKGRYKHMNRTFCQYLDFKSENIIGKTDYDLYPENIEIAEQYRKYDDKVLKNKKPELNINRKCFEIIRRTGLVFDGQIPVF